MLANLKPRRTYCTAPPTHLAGTYSKGALVSIVVVNNFEYLRTDANKTAKDNFDNLPKS